MPEDMGERTEPASERRKQEARKEGQIAYSRDLSAAVLLLAAVVGFQYFGLAMLQDALRLVRSCLSDPWLPYDADRLRIEVARLALLGARTLAPWGALIYAAALLIEYGQAGGVQVTERNFLNFGRLNPMSGFERIFSIRGLMKTAIDLGKTLLVAAVAAWFLLRELPAFVSMPALGASNIGGYAMERSLTLSYLLCAALMLLGLADYLFQRYRYEQDLRMTRQEVREEQKDLEGDPQIRARRRAIQMRLARQRMIQQVPEAEVVITNPTELAIALKYDVGEMEAPIVVAKGAGVFAKRIRELAIEHQIPLIENKPLARLLFRKVDPGRVIPEDAFLAVAEILAYVYQITKRQVPTRSTDRPK